MNADDMEDMISFLRENRVHLFSSGKEKILAMPYYSDQLTIAHMSWLADKNHMRYSEQRHKKHTIESLSNYIAYYNTGDRIIQRIITVDLEDKMEKDHIGNITIDFDKNNGIAEVGILMSPMCKRGVGGSVWREIINILSANVRKIEAGCMATNERMLRLFEKSGMTLEATIPEHFLTEYGPVDMVRYGRMRIE